MSNRSWSLVRNVSNFKLFHSGLAVSRCPFACGLAYNLCRQCLVSNHSFWSIATFAGFLIVLFAGILSLPFQSAIKPGLFPRDLAHPIYARRRLYGLCWSALYYSNPLYYVCYPCPFLQGGCFDCWLSRTTRFYDLPGHLDSDLPLLTFGVGAYLANKATLGTNLFTPRLGKILVGPITLGENALVGHLAIFGLDSCLGEKSEVGMGSLTGMRVKIGCNSVIGSGAVVSHGSQIGENVQVGECAYIGQCVEIADGLVITSGAYIPAKSVLESQDDFNNLTFAETIALRQFKAEILRDIASLRFGDDHA